MSRNRRMFDIEMPDEDPPRKPAERGGPRISTLGDERRGPMASAVRETARALRDRAETEQAIRAENDALAHEFAAARREGLVLQRVPLDRVGTTKLTRDRRLSPEDLDLAELKESIRELGLSNPIQVELAEDGFQLVQGFRRLSAFRALRAETGEDRFGAIPAVVLQPGETLQALYRRMVDENLVRKDISFAEMAALAQAYADDPDTEADDIDAAVSALYRSARPNKRSYIRAFAQMLVVLGKHLEHPEAIPRNLGLDVRKRMEADPDSMADLQRSLVTGRRHSVAEEMAILRRYAGEVAGNAEGDTKVTGDETCPTGKSAPSGGPPRKPRTTLQIASGQGPVRCTASQGRLELRHGIDFTALDRQRLEQAVQTFLDTLGAGLD
jgi:ParB family chromosome partitioning protein